MVLNNIAFLYMKLGLTEKAIEKVERALQVVEAARTRAREVATGVTQTAKGNMTRPDFFETRCEKIKYKKVRVRLTMSLCILYSERQK
jgi:hypothetical protein